VSYSHRRPLTPESGTDTPSVFSPVSPRDGIPVRHEHMEPVDGGQHRELDGRELRLMLVEFMTKNRDKASLFTLLTTLTSHMLAVWCTTYVVVILMHFLPCS